MKLLEALLLWGERIYSVFSYPDNNFRDGFAVFRRKYTYDYYHHDYRRDSGLLYA
jgi:hypothetical protein